MNPQENIEFHAGMIPLVIQLNNQDPSSRLDIAVIANAA